MKQEWKIFAVTVFVTSVAGCATKGPVFAALEPCAKLFEDYSDAALPVADALTMSVEASITSPSLWQEAGGLRVERYLVESKHDEAHIDEVIVASNLESYFSYFNNGQNVFPLCVKVEGISLGLVSLPLATKSATSIAKELGKPEGDVTAFTTSEGATFIELRYAGGKLRSLRYVSSYLD